MAESKEERERKFIKDWVSGMTERNLAKKYDISVKAVRSWKHYIGAHYLKVYKNEIRERTLPNKCLYELYQKDKQKKTHKKRGKIKRCTT